MAKILVFSHDHIGKSMAGPGIRYWEFAKVLSLNHDVTLSTPNETDIRSDDFKIVTHKDRNPLGLGDPFDVVIIQSVWPSTLKYIYDRNVKLIIDAYDPVLLEILEMQADKPIQYQNKLSQKVKLEMQLSLLAADAIICASEKQKDLWLGSLMAYGRLTPEVYQQDKSLKNIIDIVPFGLPDTKPQKTGEGFRQKFGIKPSDNVILWGGGIWNWFDPLTLIKAMEKVKNKRDDVKLVFMAVKRPYVNKNDENSRMADDALALAKKLDLTDNTVFFNYDWVPYEERANYYLESDFGVSTHFDHLETRFSFRTRMLEYLWAGLPIIATKGDTFADLIEQYNLGRVVGYKDIEDLATAILELVNSPKEIEGVKNNISKIKDKYLWNEVVKPLNRLVDELTRRDKPAISRQTKSVRNRLYPFAIKDYVRDNGYGALSKKIVRKTFRM